MEKIFIRALGQTINHNNQVSLVVKDIPADCMVLFVSMDTWKEIKDLVEMEMINATFKDRMAP